MNNDLETIRKDVSWPNRCTLPSFGWRDWRKSLKSSARIADGPAEIRTEHLPITSQGCYGYSILFGTMGSNDIVACRPVAK
jgi:hypothetical protein